MKKNELIRNDFRKPLTHTIETHMPHMVSTDTSSSKKLLDLITFQYDGFLKIVKYSINHQPHFLCFQGSPFH